MSARAADEFESWAILSALLCPPPPPPPHPPRPATPSDTPVAPASGGHSGPDQAATLAHLHQLIRTLRSLSDTAATPTPRSFGRHQSQALLAAGSSPSAYLTGFGFGPMPPTPRHVGSACTASVQAGASGAAVSDGSHAGHAAEAVRAEPSPQLSREAALAQLKLAHAQTTASASASARPGGSEASLDGALSAVPGVSPEGRTVLS